MKISRLLTKLDIDPSDCIIVGSGVMGALGIRETDDIDICVKQPIYDRFKQQGWEERMWPQGARTIHSRDIDMGTDWGDDINVYTFDSLKTHLIQIDGINYVSLEFLRKCKLNKGREKDLRDIVLIDNYLSKQKEN